MCPCRGRRLRRTTVVGVCRCVAAQSKTQAVTEPVGFGFRTLMNLDESNQLKTLRLLEAYQPILRALGYYYYREQDGVPEDMKVLLKEHIDIQTVRHCVDRARADGSLVPGFPPSTEAHCRYGALEWTLLN
jgi:hypothetical protein